MFILSCVCSVDTKSLGLVSNSLISADCNDTKKEEKDTKEESDSDEVQTPSSVRNDKVRLLQPSSTIVANEKKGVTSKVLTLSVLSSATPPQGRVKLIAGLSFVFGVLLHFFLYLQEHVIHRWQQILQSI